MTTLNFSAAADSFADALIDTGLLADKSYSVVEDEHGDSNVIFTHNGCEIKIIVSDFWEFPGEICYFVNVSHLNGNFMCQSGTNRVMRAAINVGCALHFANVSGDPIQSEEF